jgi:segregation and condensation protein A
MQSPQLSFYPNVTLQAYDGPLDLLLTLIKKNKINIYDIPIVEITDQYLEAIGLNEENAAFSYDTFNLDLGGDFIVMAAQLIYIKSVMLLPKQSDGGESYENENDAADPRSELTDMLLEYRKVKEVSYFLNNRPILGRDVFEIKVFKNDETLLEKIESAENTIFDANIFILSKYFYNKMSESQNRINIYEVTRENFSVKEKIIEIMETLGTVRDLEFGKLVKDSTCKDELFTYFLALLEMARLVLINLNQIQLFGEIYISLTANALIEYRSKIASMNG